MDKPTGPTSHDVVAQVRRALLVRRVGHCGTLDPLASGVLVLCVGSTTRLSDWLSRGEKVYEAEFQLGAYSDTDDAEGTLRVVAGVPTPTGAAVDTACAAYRGWVEQVPPAHSAVKVDGVRSYRRARRHEPVSLAPRRVRIERVEVTGYEYPRLAVRVVCGKGTYIRSLARDLGADLGCGAYVASLRRLRVGALGLQDAVGLEALRQWVGTGAPAPFVDARRALAGILEPLELDAVAAASFRHGSAVDVRLGTRGGECAVFAGGRLLGVGRFDDEGLLWPSRVFGETTHAVSEAVALATLEGTVVAGDGRGRGLGFPTANLRLEEAVDGPPQGVFAASVSWAGDKGGRRAVVNIGCRPTFGAAGLLVEVHVLDFDGDLYGQRLRVRLERRLREERRFEGAEALVRQIERDIALARSP